MKIKYPSIEQALYGLAFLVALGLRLYRLGAAPLTDFEANWALQALNVAHGSAANLGANAGYVMLTSLLFILFGSKDALARLLPALAGSLLVFVPLFGRQVVNRTGSKARTAGLILAFGLAIDPGLVALSRLAGGPVPALLFGLVALLSIVALLRNDSTPVKMVIEGEIAASPAEETRQGSVSASPAEERLSDSASSTSLEEETLPRSISITENEALPREFAPTEVKGSSGTSLLWLAGISGGLALISGTPIVQGALGLALTWGAVRVMEKAGLLDPAVKPEGEPGSEEAGERRGDSRGAVWKMLGLVAAGTILVVGTFFLRFPQGLGALGATFPNYLGRWTNLSDVSALQLLAVLAVYQLLPLIFGLIGAVRGWVRGDALAQRLSLWAVLAVALALIVPGHQVTDLVWGVVALWALAALELAEHVPSEEDAMTLWVALGEAILIILLIAVVWLNVLGAVERLQGNLTLYILLITGVILMGAVTTALVALGWSLTAARYGVVGGAALMLTLYTISGAWGVSQLRPNGPQELWGIAPATGQARLLANTLENLSNWSTGEPHTMDMVVMVDIPSMRWALRDFENARYLSSILSTEQPAVVISPQAVTTLSMAASYRGEAFVWWLYPGWQSALPPDTLRWLAFRSAPVTPGQVILWARSDIFPGGALAPVVDNTMQEVPPVDVPTK